MIGAPSKLGWSHVIIFVYYKSRKRELKAKLMNESV